MPSFRKILIKENLTIRDAMIKLSKTQERILIVVNNKHELIGTLNDGDIRRALLKNFNLESKISKITNKNPIIANTNVSDDEIYNNLNEKIIGVPIIDLQKRVVGFYSLKNKTKFNKIKTKNITIAGMGYVGLTLAVTLANLGFRVFGYDKNIKIISKLKKNIAPFHEVGLSKYLKKNSISIDYSTKLNNDSSCIYILAVGSPIKKNKVPDIKEIKKITYDISKILKKDDLVIIRSTLPIGTTRKIIIPILEKNSKLKCGAEFYIVCAPERTAEGMALSELRTNPQIIGGYNQESTNLAMQLFNTFTNSVIPLPDLESAELSKLIDNSYRDNQFAFSNQFISLAEKINVDLTEIIKAVNHNYPRNKIAIPSPGVGGPCLSKDPYILDYAFTSYKIKNKNILNSRAINESITDYLFQKLKEMLKKINKNPNNAKIFIIGLAFKGNPETSDFRNSTTVDFLKKFNKRNNLHVYDPVITKKDFNLDFKYSNIYRGFKNADAVIFMNNHKSYANLEIFNLINLMHKPAIFIDTWKIFNKDELKRIEKIYFGGLGND